MPPDMNGQQNGENTMPSDEAIRPENAGPTTADTGGTSTEQTMIQNNSESSVLTNIIPVAVSALILLAGLLISLCFRK